MIRVALLVLALSGAAPALAQTVTIRSGAHDGFDRLVLDLPRRVGYRIASREGGATFVFDLASLRFDLADAFTRIDRSRLRALGAPAESGQLRLELACDCALRPFWHGAAMLVIDIADPPSESRAIFPPDIPMPSLAAETLAARLGPASVTDAPVDPEPALPPAPDFDRMRSALLQQFGRAASQGLVTTTPGLRDLHRIPPPRDTDEGDHEADETATGPVALRARTGMELDEPGAGARAGPSGSRCPEPDHVDVPSWGDPAGLPVGMGRVYRTLFGEFDAINPQAVQDLARVYIHYGFGAEARQILDLSGAGDAATQLLGELAELVDQRPLPEGALLHRAVACGEPAVFWALLARPEIDPGLVFDHAALQRSFAALPAGLRETLGPGLVRKLEAVGHVGTARHLQRMIEPVGTDKPGTAPATKGDTDPLAALGGINSIQAAEALARDIEAALLRGEPVTRDQAELAGAYALELRDDALGDRLATAHVAALAASGAFEAAADEFDRLAVFVKQPVVRTMAESVLRELTLSADDITFLRYVLSDHFLSPEAMPDALAAAIARRLLDAGFVDAADHVLLPGKATRDHRLLRAELALSRGRPAQAELELMGLEGAQVDQLRARARSLLSDHATAQALYRASNALEEADRAALHTRDPATLASADDPTLRDLAQILDARPVPNSPDSMLDQGRGLLEESGVARDVLTRLLAETSKPKR